MYIYCNDYVIISVTKLKFNINQVSVVSYSEVSKPNFLLDIMERERQLTHRH